MTLPKPGDYVAKLNDRIVIYEAGSGALCAALPCIISQGDSTGFTTKATVVLVKSDGTILSNAVDNLKAVFGWDGADPFTLMDNDYKDIEFMLADCKHEEYEGKINFKPGWVNPLGGGMKMPEPADRRSVLAKYGSKFRALAGGAPVSSPSPQKKTPPPPAKKSAATPPPAENSSTATMDQAWEALCESNPKMAETDLQNLWFSELKGMFPGKTNSDLSPQDWGALKEKFTDNVPA
jgi:hypothetical protein